MTGAFFEMARTEREQQLEKWAYSCLDELNGGWVLIRTVWLAPGVLGVIYSTPCGAAERKVRFELFHDERWVLTDNFSPFEYKDPVTGFGVAAVNIITKEPIDSEEKLRECAEKVIRCNLYGRGALFEPVPSLVDRFDLIDHELIDVPNYPGLDDTSVWVFDKISGYVN